MDTLTITTQLLLYGHIIAFAVAIAEVLRADWRLLRRGSIDVAGLKTTSRLMAAMLALLWASGLALVYLKVGLDVAALLASPKMVAKLLVVTLLTVNGAVLHLLVFPRLRQGDPDPQTVRLATIFGAVSSASWLYASFVGVARIISTDMTLAMFLALYAGTVAAAIAVSMTLLRPRVAAALSDVVSEQSTPAALPNDTRIAFLREVEVALRALGNAHNQLLSLRSAVIDPGQEPAVPAQSDGRQVRSRAPFAVVRRRPAAAGG